MPMPWIVALILGVLLIFSLIRQQDEGRTMEDTAYCTTQTAHITDPGRKAAAMAECRKALVEMRERLKQPS